MKRAILLLALIATPAVAQPVRIRVETPRDMAGILGAVRVMTTECKLAVDSNLLGPAARRYGFNFVDFAPTGRFFALTKKAMDENYALIAQRGLGPACRGFSQLIELTMPELLGR
jgi:hypothetical protein